MLISYNPALPQTSVSGERESWNQFWGQFTFLGTQLGVLWVSVWAALHRGCFLQATHLYRGHLSVASPAELRKLQRIKSKANLSSIRCSAIFNLILHMMQIREIVVVFRSFINK